MEDLGFQVTMERINALLTDGFDEVGSRVPPPPLCAIVLFLGPARPVFTSFLGG